VSLGFAGYFFYALAGMALAASLMVVTRRNPVHSAMFLVFAFFCVAGVYVTLSAEFLAAVQVLVYAGGIVVLFLFVIMLVPLQPGLKPLRIRQAAVALLVTAMVASAFMVIYGQIRGGAGAGAGGGAPSGTVESIGVELYTRYLLPFEVASVLLLVAMVGAVVLARKQI
jgi:NADH-quinone oxidoreductase subunit J